jgi:hypothetical protein
VPCTLSRSRNVNFTDSRIAAALFAMVAYSHSGLLQPRVKPVAAYMALTGQCLMEGIEVLVQSSFQLMHEPFPLRAWSPVRCHQSDGRWTDRVGYSILVFSKAATSTALESPSE